MPSEFSSGTSRVQGSITKAGNTHVRRLLIEAAWHHRKSYSTSGPSLRARWAKVDPALRARGHAGNRRLYSRWQGFTERKKNPLVANVAVARELSGWCAGRWSPCKATAMRLGWSGNADVGAVSEPICREPRSHNAIRPRSTVTLVCRQR